ncbi:MAG: hypothetical protein ACI8RW_000572, partial [Porticoccaceae bacterium]
LPVFVQPIHLRKRPHKLFGLIFKRAAFDFKC